ncbi:MAG: Hsp20/alpha crystallin family protein [Bradymonadaceae bacterium]|nr:Hsp20/alpha crystallin family protein [Lujinxingiaceae bacterium]
MYQPRRSDDSLSQFRNELRDLFGPSNLRQVGGVFPLVNIYDDGESFMVRAEMAGIDKSSLDVSCKGEQIIIRGERVHEAVEESANYHRREREAGQFRRVVTLPQPIDGQKVMAEYKDGILEIYAPRSEEAKPRKIKIS